MCINVLATINIILQFGFRFQSIFDTAPAAPKNNKCFKSGQMRLEYNRLALFTKVQPKSLTHSKDFKVIRLNALKSLNKQGATSEEY